MPSSHLWLGAMIHQGLEIMALKVILKINFAGFMKI